MHWKLRALAISAPIVIAACTETSHLSTSDVKNDSDVSGEFALSVPGVIASARAVNLDALYARVIVNGREQSLSDGNLITTFSARIGSTLEIGVLWYEEQPSQSEDLLLATWATSQLVSGNTSITVLSEDYDSGEDDGDAGIFDADNDGFSNLNERRRDSDPYNVNETPLNRPDVRIGKVSSEEAPIIDGFYEPVWGERATFNDANAEPLAIDNLMINQGALRPDGNTEFRWFAMHDDENLYVFVLGENVDISTPLRDSTNVWEDDTVNLFIDGDNSKNEVYDNKDDRHVFVPLLTTPDNPTSNSTVFVNGEFSASRPSFEFATCLCSSDQHTWEFKLPFNEFDIEKGKPFGFEIQIDEDNNGGARDARWGWIHPSRTDQDIDNTWKNPSFMGTAIVE